MDESYLKYINMKRKYVALKQNMAGGGKSKGSKTKSKTDGISKSPDAKNKTAEHSIDIVEYLNKAPLSDIQSNLLTIMSNTEYCDTVLGSGMMGEVYVSGVNKKMPVITSSKKRIKMKSVIKTAHTDPSNDPSNILEIKIISGVLYVQCYKNITGEAIILSYLNKLWHEKRSPHLPYMIGYSCCNNKDRISVNRIVTERHGLDKKIMFDMDGFSEDTFWHPAKDTNLLYNKFDSNLSTLSSLLQYIDLKSDPNNNNDGKVILPNNQECDAINLIDSICISYIHTAHLLSKQSITPADMHFNNIFVQWLSKDSYIDDRPIGDVGYIEYKIRDKVLRIKTYGLLIKLGDVGSFIVHPRQDLYVLGQAADLEQNLQRDPDLFNYMTNPEYGVIWFLMNFKFGLPLSIYDRTIVSKILSTYPYNTIAHYKPFPYDAFEHLLSFEDMLDFYKAYYVDMASDKESTVLIVEDN